MPRPVIAIAALLPMLSACGGGAPCPGPNAEWIAAAAAAPQPAPAGIDSIVIDAQDRILWNGAIMSEERLRNTLSLADADGRTVRLTPQPGATCQMIGRMRVAMERALACGKGRCLESAAGQPGS
ncbi:hypothetical protein [Sphingomonas colocasiae]|uniref:Uncharacterized protein n=1 Tax=Sphingomonas colocasiae TaxID=1848973 RepID=A0ABS7Q1Y9_9SPHN|nr:hypothetical protein [Sphingomonas colocasiae]MBY8826244.1 hypothetical protein [Sphingomonas colocasiae]